MKTASISTLKASLSEYLDAVRRGEEVLITDRGRAVGRIVPVGGADSGQERYQKLVREGILAPPAVTRALDYSPPPGKKPSGVLRALLDERAEGR